MKKGNRNGIILPYFFCIIIILLTLNGVASASSYYVATYGSNSNSGNQPNPWQNVSYAVQQAEAGDIIYLIDGTWYNEYVTFSKSGTATHPITLTAYNGTPTLYRTNKSDTTMPRTGIAFDNGTHDIIISGLTVLNYYSAISASDFITIYNVTIKNNNLTDTGFILMNIGRGSHNITISNNIFSYAGWNTLQLVGLQSANVYNNQLTHNITITNNLFLNNTGHTGGIDFSGEFQDILVHNNTFINSLSAIYQHDGLVYGTTRLNFSNNTMINSYYVRISMLKDSIINFNILNISRSSGFGDSSFTKPPINVTLEGNRVSNTVGSAFRLITNNSYGCLLLTDNILSNTSGYIFEEGNLTCAIVRYTSNLGFIFDVNAQNNANVTTEFFDGTIFSIVKSGGTVENYIAPSWYSDKSNFSFSSPNISGATYKVTPYPMTARSTTSPATVTVNSFNTSLSAGKELASFTANTTNTNTVAFTMSTLTPGKRYLVNVGGTLVNTTYADNDGVIRFSHSDWPADVFTVVGDATYVPNPNPTPTVSPTPPPGQVSGDLNGDRVVDEKDVVIVDQHMGNVTSPPYPNYDINQDGIVDVLDMQFVTDKIPLSLVDQVYNFLRSLI